MENNNRSPAGLHITWNPLDYSRNVAAGASPDKQAYDIGAAADYNACLFVGNNYDICEQAYDIGDAADFNDALLKRKNDKIDELASVASLNTPLRSALHAINSVPEAQVFLPIGFSAVDQNVPDEIFPA
ncbi:hypothetical protein BOTCAL_0327g00090 [Botryotinia calthae]|uniref:Uncharacterized protein n=1 Tax=Botryotinia calthae TaxID=38488 RepID=A0A4Y8CTD1_9HELO|nr:hypothetical protein BOTCAL_0327g00090 [Botryotinia calthae]